MILQTRRQGLELYSDDAGPNSVRAVTLGVDRTGHESPDDRYWLRLRRQFDRGRVIRADVQASQFHGYQGVARQ